MKNHRSRIGADILIVLDADGRVVASTLSISAAAKEDLQGLVAGDGDGRMLRLYRLIDGRPYQLVISPVLATDTIGWAAIRVRVESMCDARTSSKRTLSLSKKR